MFPSQPIELALKLNHVISLNWTDKEDHALKEALSMWVIFLFNYFNYCASLRAWSSSFVQFKDITGLSFNASSVGDLGSSRRSIQQAINH